MAAVACVYVAQNLVTLLCGEMMRLHNSWLMMVKGLHRRTIMRASVFSMGKICRSR
jgi:hypothetical protein